MTMGQKNIPVDTKTYELLKALKRPNESFRELILRLIRERRTRILDHFGRWNMTDEEVEDLMHWLDEGWKSWTH